MKPIPLNIYHRPLKALLPLALMTTTLASYAEGSLPVTSTIMITKNMKNKRHKVKLFTASDYKTLLFTVDGVDDKRYTLYVFDLEGKLMIQSVILNHETSILSEIPSGTYLYEVLANDTKVENGELKVNNP
jgi:hypothetical protein